MSNFLHSPYIKAICCYLALVVAGFLPGPMEARASFISHQSEETTKLDPESLETFRIALEHELIAEKLSELGLTEEEIIQRIEQLSPEETEIVLKQLDSIQSGGFIGALALLIFPLMLLIFTIMQAAEKSHSPKSERIIYLWEKGSDSFPAWEKEVGVLQELPDKENIFIGKVRIIDNRDDAKMLSLMREKAAEHGANAIIPEETSPRNLYNDLKVWNAIAIRIQENED